MGRDIREAADRFDRLVPEAPVVEQLRSDVTFAKYPLCFGRNGHELVNVYAIEMDRWAPVGIRFADRGEHCLRLAGELRRAHPQFVCAMNCNFGLIVDEFDKLPPDISYNLRLDDDRVVQLPIADKTALLIDDQGRLSISMRDACGLLTVGDRRVRWRGSMSQRALPSAELPSTITVFSPFNRPVVVSRDPVTGTRRRFEVGHETIPSGEGQFEALIDSSGRRPVVAAVHEAGRAHLFDAHMIFGMPPSVASGIRVGDEVTAATLDGEDLSAYKYGATVGAILTRDPVQTRRNMARSETVRTRAADTGVAVYDGVAKFARACIVLTPSRMAFVLIDARRRVAGQEGMTISDLRRFLEKMYPDFEQAVSVDGGHAAKMVVAKDDRLDVYGNLHYKRWPTQRSPAMRWNGVLGALLPSVIYALS